MLFAVLVQLVEDMLQIIELLACLAKFAFRCEALIIGEVFAGWAMSVFVFSTGLIAAVASGA